MASTEVVHLVSMANDIAVNLSFHANADERIADHINRFWAPRMRSLLLEYAASDGQGLSEALLSALKKTAGIMKFGKPAGVILAGGQSSRMGVSRKALLELNGQSLLARVIERLQAHVDPLMLSCESETNEFDGFGLQLVSDLLPPYRGPLTGLCSALQYLADKGYNQGLVLCPCDAPFIPEKLVQVLLDADRSEKKPVVVISYQGVLQPTFSLWQNHHLPVVQDAVVNKGTGGLKHVLTSIPHTVVEWALAEPPPFFNVNTPADLKTAALWLDRMHA